MRWYGPMVVIPSWMCASLPTWIHLAYFGRSLVRSPAGSICRGQPCDHPKMDIVPCWREFGVHERDLKPRPLLLTIAACRKDILQSEEMWCKVLRPLGFSAAKVVARWLELQDLHLFHMLNKCTFQVLDYDHTPAPVWSRGWQKGPKESRPEPRKLEKRRKAHGVNLWDPTEQCWPWLAPVKTVWVSFYRFIHVYPSLSNSGSTQLSPMMTFCPAILCTVQPQEHPVAMLWISWEWFWQKSWRENEINIDEYTRNVWGNTRISWCQLYI